MCSFDAVPTPTITWKVNGTEIVSGNDNYIIRTLDTTSFLDIIGTELETSGDYMCGATNLLGTSSDQEELIVQGIHIHTYIICRVDMQFLISTEDCLQTCFTIVS